MKTRLDISHLRMVKAIAELGNVTKAAQVLGITQSALSHRIKEAERRLGNDLFDRKSKTLTLTLSGKRLLYTANRVLFELEKAEQQITRTAVDDQRSVRIAFQAEDCFWGLPKVIRKITNKYDDLLIDIITDVPNDPLQALDKKVVDIAIMQSKPVSQYHTIKTLFTDELLVILPAQHRYAKKAYLTAEDFTDETLITHNFELTKGTEYDAFFKKDISKLKKIMQISLTEAIIELVDAQLGIAIFPRWVITPYLNNYELIPLPLTNQGLFTQWYAVSKELPDSSTTSIILKEIVAEVQHTR